MQPNVLFRSERESSVRNDPAQPEACEGQDSRLIAAGLIEVLEMSDQMILVTDASGRIEYVNSAYVEGTGFSAEELRDERAYMYVQVLEEMDAVREALEILNSGRTWRGRLVLARKAAESLAVKVSIKPRHGSSGEVSGFVAFAEPLPATASGRGDDKGESRVELEAVNHMANGVAHRFNNLLASMMGQVELLGMMAGDNAALQERIRRVLEAGERGRAVVAQLMRFCRKRDEHARPLDLAPVLRNALRQAVAESGAGIRVQCDLPEEMAQVKGLGRDLHDVVQQLLINAMQACADGAGERVGLSSDIVWACRWPQTDSGQADAEEPGLPFVRISVTDDGAGMTPDVKAHLFEPFFTTRNLADALGMGLATVASVATRHRGVVAVSSKAGLGTRVDVLLPVYGELPATLEQEAKEAPRGNGETVLLLDSSHRIAETGREQLMQLGYRVISLSDALRGLEILEQEPDTFDLLILSAGMPKLTVAQFTERLNEHSIHLPILLTHTFADRPGMPEELETAFAATLLKPCTAQDLGWAVARVLSAQAS